jgi:hypothetical protein
VRVVQTFGEVLGVEVKQRRNIFIADRDTKGTTLAQEGGGHNGKEEREKEGAERKYKKEEQGPKVGQEEV